MTTFGDQVFQYGGVPVNGFLTTGKTFFVKPNSGSDGNTGKTPDKALKTLAKAQSLATADKGDVVYLVAESNTAANTTDYQSSVLSWSKDGVHLIGIGANPMVGKRARIATLSTSTAFANLMTIDADNCYISSFAIVQEASAGDYSGSQYALQVSGMRNRLENMQIQGIGFSDMDEAGSRSLYLTGAENTIYDCYIGLNTIVRATSGAEIGIASGATRTFFDKCVVESWTSNTAFKALTIADGSYHNTTWLRDCMLCATQNITSAVAPTGAISKGAASGAVFLHNTFVYGYADVATADDTNIYVSPSGGGVAGHVDFGVAKQVDIA